MIFVQKPKSRDPLRKRIDEFYRADEAHVVNLLLKAAQLPVETVDRIADRARKLVIEIRKQRVGKGGLDAFMHEYELSTQEGIVLMCLAEALLRIPDAETAGRLIRDKLGSGDWEKHLRHSESVFVNASTWALMLTGQLVGLHYVRGQSLKAVLGRLVNRAGEPVVRQAITQAMRILSRQFIMGRTIEEALEHAKGDRGYRHSFDMLGEAAQTASAAAHYLDAYHEAVSFIGENSGGLGPIEGPGISVKLSALHPRYEFAQRERVLRELTPRLLELALHAKEFGLGLTVDAEEADRLDLSLDIIEVLASETALADWDGLGLAVPGYQKRALPMIDWLADIARQHRRRLMIRLVKGAYWDSEIKHAQERGLDGYPVFTRKASTDVSYIACARRAFENPDCFYPQFATHNAHTLATVVELAGERQDFEFQLLHGMGQALYEQVAGADGLGLPCRIYAPVGSHEDLLPYLVRRLLENGSNTSFVSRIVDELAPIEDLIADPVSRVRRLEHKPHPHIPLPRDLYRPERANSRGIDLTDIAAVSPLQDAMEAAVRGGWSASPIVGGVVQAGNEQSVLDPADLRRVTGSVVHATSEHIENALARAARAAPEWDQAGAEFRAKCLEDMADLLERDMGALMALTVREAGKTLPDAVAEVREAVDFCRYYAARCRADFSKPIVLPGPTGEENKIALHGRGAFVCISPWNFPLAIFTGQVAAALAAGNAVIAKPAEQTPLIAARAVRLFHEAGVPPNVLHLLPGLGESVGAPLVADERIAGVAFTGSTETAHLIHRSLAAKEGPIVPLIAETGGQNAMIVDSSALPNQVVTDVLTSAFHSAGQRCSALRVLFLQREIAPKLIEMLAGAMAELKVGDPGLLQTDVGPVIDRDALEMLKQHSRRMEKEGKLIYQCELSDECSHGNFFAPRAFEIDSLSRLKREVFGPILHVVRYDATQLDEVIDAINRTGYGLTFSIHSRIDSTIEHVCKRLKVGNIYVNRHQVGAVVGVQPFGGEGLSGTGPKAGGPRYLYRFATERTLSINTTAQGGNADLISLQEEDLNA